MLGSLPLENQMDSTYLFQELMKLESQSSQISIHHYKVNHILAEQKLENIDARVSWLVMILRLNYYVNSEWGSFYNYVDNKRWASGPEMSTFKVQNVHVDRDR